MDSYSPPGNANLRIGVLKDSNKTKSANTEIGAPRKSVDVEIGAPGETAWHSRGYLPHFDPAPNDNPRGGAAALIQHITFHLADSLPKPAILRLESELKSLPAHKQDTERRKRIDAYIDAGHGSCILQNPNVAAMVQESLLRFDSERYRLIAWVVMPNHVHALIEPLGEWTVAKIVAAWKKFTATTVRGENFSGRMWHREYWDRYIRDEAHFRRAIDYIHQNPVKANLAATPELYRWSSAFPGNANLRIGVVKDSDKSKSANTEIGAPRKTI